MGKGSPFRDGNGAKALNGSACLEIPVEKDFGSPLRVVPVSPVFDTRIAQVTN